MKVLYFVFGTVQHLFDSFLTSSRKSDYQFVQVYFNVTQLAKGRQNMSIILSVLVESFDSCLSDSSPLHFATSQHSFCPPHSRALSAAHWGNKGNFR